MLFVAIALASRRGAPSANAIVRAHDRMRLLVGELESKPGRAHRPIGTIATSQQSTRPAGLSVAGGSGAPENPCGTGATYAALPADRDS